MLVAYESERQVEEANTRVERVLRLYLDSAVDAQTTRLNYRIQISAAMRAMGISDIVEITGEHLASYRASVMRSTAAPATKSLRITCVRSFLRWCAAMGLPLPPTEMMLYVLRTPRAVTVNPMRAVPDDHFAAILAAANGVQELAIVAVLGGAGLRACEVGLLDVRDFDGAALTVRYGKGMRGRQVPVHPDLAAILERQLALHSHRLDASAPLFPWHAGGERYNTDRVGALVHRVGHRALPGVRPYTPHCFRHMFAMRCLATHHDVVAVSKLLGHASISTTQRYVDHLKLSELAMHVAPMPVIA